MEGSGGRENRPAPLRGKRWAHAQSKQTFLTTLQNIHFSEIYDARCAVKYNAWMGTVGTFIYDDLWICIGKKDVEQNGVEINFYMHRKCVQSV